MRPTQSVNVDLAFVFKIARMFIPTSLRLLAIPLTAIRSLVSVNLVTFQAVVC